LLLTAFAGNALARPTPSVGLFGVWANPSNSVHVAMRPCDAAVCGIVVWATDKAKADAARGGNASLVGMNLFQDFTRVDDTHWKGRVYVPDIDLHFSGRIHQIDNNTLSGKGCLIGGILCRSQVWKRVD
jgi:uncharacterized protein (DUF2147 family)